MDISTTRASLVLLNVKENKAFLLLRALGCYMPFTATVSCLGERRLQDMKYNREGPGTEICCVPSVRRQHRPFLTSARALLSRQCRACKVSNSWSFVALTGDSQPCRVPLSCCGKMQVMSVVPGCTSPPVSCFVFLPISDMTPQRRVW